MCRLCWTSAWGFKGGFDRQTNRLTLAPLLMSWHVSLGPQLLAMSGQLVSLLWVVRSIMLSSLATRDWTVELFVKSPMSSCMVSWDEEATAKTAKRTMTP